jgi:hypothetical protein
MRSLIVLALVFVGGGCSGPSTEPPKYRPASNEIAAPPAKPDEPAADEPTPEPDALDDPIERAAPTWWCICYQREVAGKPEPVTACRQQESECLALQKAVAKGGRDMVRGSMTQACQSIIAAHPGDAHGGREAWQPSKKAGAWVSNGACQLPGGSNADDEEGSGGDDFSLMQAESIGPLKIGMADAEVVKHVGKPSERGKREMWGADGLYHQSWRYPQQGLVLDMESDEPKSLQQVGSVQINAPSTLKTARGITIGSSRSEVLEHYGAQRDLDHLDPDEDDPSQFVAGSIYGGLVFRFENDQVSEIFLGAAAE